MSDTGFRDLGSTIPAAWRTDGPPAKAPPAKIPSRPAPGLAEPTSSPLASASPAVLASAAGPAAGPRRSGPLGPLVERLVHAGARTPFSIGVLGPPGAGKTLAMTALAEAAAALSAAARQVASSPFVARLAVVRIDAAQADGHPARAFAASLYERLCADYPACAAKALASSRDPRIEAREAAERLDAGRRRLDAERVALEDADSRRARLTETALYEAAGSQIEAYASANRGRIANALSAREQVSARKQAGDPVLRFKHMVRTLAESGAGARAGFALRAFWALDGQSGLLVTAFLLALCGLGLGAAVAEQTTWLGWMRANEGLAGLAAFLQSHMSWLSVLRQAAFAGAALAFAVNIWRALRLIRLSFRGADLLRSDLAGRRREADARFAHHTRRVEALAAECDALARRAAEAEQRAGGLPLADALTPAEPFGADPVKQQAERFIASAGALAAASRGKDGEAPQRILMAIDNLDAVPIARAGEILACARAVFGPGFATLVAIDPARSEVDRASLDWIDAPVQAGEIAALSDAARLVRAALDGAPPQALPFAEPDPGRSAFDEPLPEAEALLLEAMAPIAARSARAATRFVTLYRLARVEGVPHGALAFLLALDAGGTEAELAAVADALAASKTANSVDFPRVGPRLAKALTALKARHDEPDAEGWRRAAAAARLYSFRS